MEFDDEGLTIQRKAKRQKVDETGGEESQKVPPPAEPTRAQRIEKIYQQEMGFSIVVEHMIKTCKSKPIIGHNPMYDLLYFYNQFIAPLPTTYSQFIKEWTDLFGQVYDNKVLAYQHPSVFSKTVLGDIFEKVDSDENIKKLVEFKFDDKNEFVKYAPAPPSPPPKVPQAPDGDKKDGVEKEVEVVKEKEIGKETKDVGKEVSKEIKEVSKEIVKEVAKEVKKNPFHEAGYDAYITGVSFVRTLKY